MLSRLLDLTSPPSLNEVEAQASEMSFIRFLVPFEGEILSRLLPVIVRKREEIGRYRFPPQSDGSVHFSPLEFDLLFGHYVGERNASGQKHGRGIGFYMLGRCIMEGEWLYGNYTGVGRLIFHDGSVCEGKSPYSDRRHLAIYTLSDNSEVLTGEARSTAKEEIYRTHRTTSGWTYEGSHLGNSRSGWGIETTPKWRYEGEWTNGQREGAGTCTYNDGSCYTGAWAKNYRHGEGVLRYADGSLYSGTWKQGKRSGQGRMMEEGQWEYSGEWENDKRHGRGVCKYADGTTQNGVWVDDHFAEGSA